MKLWAFSISASLSLLLLGAMRRLFASNERRRIKVAPEMAWVDISQSIGRMAYSTFTSQAEIIFLVWAARLGICLGDLGLGRIGA